ACARIINKPHAMADTVVFHEARASRDIVHDIRCRQEQHVAEIQLTGSSWMGELCRECLAYASSNHWIERVYPRDRNRNRWEIRSCGYGSIHRECDRIASASGNTGPPREEIPSRWRSRQLNA